MTDVAVIINGYFVATSESYSPTDIENAKMSWLVQKQFNVLMGMTVPGFYKKSKIYAAYSIFVEICLLSFVMSYFIAGRMEQDPSKRIYSFSAGTLTAQALSVRLYTRYYRSKLLDLVEECTPYQSEELSPQYRHIPRILPYIMNGIVTVLCTIYDVSPLVPILNPEGKKNLCIPAYYPFEIEDSPYFEIAVLYEGISAVYNCGTSAAFFDIYVNMGARLISKYYHLRKDLPRVFNDKENIQENLRHWIKRHQQATRLEKKFQDVFAPGLLILLLFEVCLLCLVVYDCTMVQMDTLNRVVLTSSGLGFFFKLFVMTRCGDHITHESNRITEEGFGARWYELPLEAQNSFKIIICRARRDITISAMGFFNLNTETFRTFVLSSYSYYAVLTELV